MIDRATTTLRRDLHRGRVGQFDSSLPHGVFLVCLPDTRAHRSLLIKALMKRMERQMGQRRKKKIYASQFRFSMFLSARSLVIISH